MCYCYYLQAKDLLFFVFAVLLLLLEFIQKVVPNVSELDAWSVCELLQVVMNGRLQRLNILGSRNGLFNKTSSHLFCVCIVEFCVKIGMKGVIG